MRFEKSSTENNMKPSHLDSIRESFEDVSLDLNSYSKHGIGNKHGFYGINRANSIRSINNLSSVSINGKKKYTGNYSNPSFINNSSKDALLTSSPSLPKLNSSLRRQKSLTSNHSYSSSGSAGNNHSYNHNHKRHLEPDEKDKIVNDNTPENLNTIDFLSDDELPDNLIVFDIPTLDSLSNHSTRRKPSIRRKKSMMLKKDEKITNTSNIIRQIESTSNNTKNTPPQRTASSSLNQPYKSTMSSLMNLNPYSSLPHSSVGSSPATRASSIFSKSSEVSDFIYIDDDLNLLSAETRLLFDNKDNKLEDSLQRVSMLRNLSHLSVSSMNSVSSTISISSSTSTKKGIVPLSIENNTKKYLSTTRQINLPPKSKQELLKHEKDCQKLVENEILRESEKIKTMKMKQKKSRKQNEKDLKLWNKVINNYEVLIQLPQTRELYWRMVPEKLRAEVWMKQLISKKKSIIGSDILEESLKNANLILVDACNYKLNEGHIKDDESIVEHIDFIERCSDKLQYSFPEMKFFQYGENFDSVLEILIAFESVKFTTEKLQNINSINLINLVCLIFHVIGDKLHTLICMISLVSRKLPNTMINADENLIPDTLTKELQLEENESNSYLLDIKDQFDKYLLQLLPNLYNHFIKNDINSLKIVSKLVDNLFANLLEFDVNIRILDIYLFEGDTFLLRTCLALLKKMSYKLYGNHQEIYSFFKINNDLKREFDENDYIDVGEVDDFINDIRGILKKK